MQSQRRRTLVKAALAALAAAPALARAQAGDAGATIMHVRDASIARLPPNAEAQKSSDSAAPRAARAGRWAARAPLPFPRSEMAWAAAWNGRMHVVGYSEKNRLPHEDVYVFDIAKGEWRAAAPLPRARAAASVVALNGRIHVIAGASGRDIRKSVDWHEVYDPAADKWETRAPLPEARDHAGAVVFNGRIHVVGGGFDGSSRSTDLHHAYDAKTDTWENRAPLPTPRNGHAAAVLRDRIFALGGETTGKVHGQNEGYDAKADRWESYAPVLTPRHGGGAAAIGNAIYFAGGAPVAGTTFLTSVNEAFSLN